MEHVNAHSVYIGVLPIVEMCLHFNEKAVRQTN
jgi:hypothetical protein